MKTLAHMATLKPKQHFQVLGAACAAIQMASNGGLCLFQQDNTKNILYVLQQHGSGVIESKC